MRFNCHVRITPPWRRYLFGHLLLLQLQFTRRALGRGSRLTHSHMRATGGRAALERLGDENPAPTKGYLHRDETANVKPARYIIVPA